MIKFLKYRGPCTRFFIWLDNWLCMKYTNSTLNSLQGKFYHWLDDILFER